MWAALGFVGSFPHFYTLLQIVQVVNLMSGRSVPPMVSTAREIAYFIIV